MVLHKLPQGRSEHKGTLYCGMVPLHIGGIQTKYRRISMCHSSLNTVRMMQKQITCSHSYPYCTYIFQCIFVGKSNFPTFIYFEEVCAFVWSH